MKHFKSSILLAVAAVLWLRPANADQSGGIGVPLYTIETDHFRINYQRGLHRVAQETGEILERLYSIYHDTYRLTLPDKTEVVVLDDDRGGGFAFPNFNMVAIWANDMDFNLRGTHDWLEDVVTHEYAHIVSIWSSFKLPPWMVYTQGGHFSHPNNLSEVGRADKEGNRKRISFRTEVLHVFPGDILPPWFFEGIAQFESSRHGSDRWDTHRDMILRTLTMSNTLLSWDHMAVFTGKGDDYEKTYNHGFSMVRYITETYGYEAVVSILRESSKFFRLNFDRSIKEVLGISARELYRDWQRWLEKRYNKQVKEIGEQVYGRKINKEGYDNRWPRFSPDENEIYFVSNAKNDYSLRGFYSYSLLDTVEDDKRIKREPLPVKDFYSIHDSSGLIAFSSTKSPKSTLPFNEGGVRVRDVFIDTLPPEKKTFRFPWQKTERQVTQKASLFAAAFSPTGDRLAATHHRHDRYYLCITDTTGVNLRVVYPDTTDTIVNIQTIYSLDWSPDGSRIAMSYIDRNNRKVGIYDTTSGEFTVVCDTKHDERDPRFNDGGTRLYFSSDRTGIFNIYRLDFEEPKLERLTNVSGGAFAPDVSAGEDKLVYVNYDKDGYGIYLIDTLRVVEEVAADSMLQPRTPVQSRQLTTKFSAPRRYSRLPRQVLAVPTLLAEEIVTEDENPYRGEKVFKAGAVFNLFDPFALAGYGHELGGYFLIEPHKILRFFDDKTIINPEVNYDLGAFGYTSTLPLELSFEYLHRGVAGSEVFQSEADEALHLKYNLTPRYLDFVVSKPLKNLINMPLKVHGIASYNWYDITLFVDEYSRSAFNYTPAKGFRLGTYLTFMQRARDSRTYISPRGLALKVKYDFYGQRLQNEEKRFDSQFHVNYDFYRFNQVTGSARYGIPMPWSDKHALYAEAWATALRLTPGTVEHLRKDTYAYGDELPPFFEPIAWLPGYTYYYRDTLPEPHVINGALWYDTVAVDTVLISGDAVAQAKLSYRFPLWPGSIDKKLGFFYFDKLYGAINFNMGTAWNEPGDILDRAKRLREEPELILDYLSDDWLKAAGAELRLEAITFGTLPFALSMRWDWGYDKPMPLGGHRFTLGVGFDFDYWDLIDLPDYRAPWRRPAAERQTMRVGM